MKYFFILLFIFLSHIAFAVVGIPDQDTHDPDEKPNKQEVQQITPAPTDSQKDKIPADGTKESTPGNAVDIEWAFININHEDKMKVEGIIRDEITNEENKRILDRAKKIIPLVKRSYEATTSALKQSVLQITSCTRVFQTVQ